MEEIKLKQQKIEDCDFEVAWILIKMMKPQPVIRIEFCWWQKEWVHIRCFLVDFFVYLIARNYKLQLHMCLKSYLTWLFRNENIANNDFRSRNKIFFFFGRWKESKIQIRGKINFKNWIEKKFLASPKWLDREGLSNKNFQKLMEGFRDHLNFLETEWVEERQVDHFVQLIFRSSI